ncbi:MAG: AAA family ATPase [Candidatus Omnitrophota bacterium]
MKKIIAICNQKGGTGKTTTAINLSSYLAIAGKRVLLIDLDPQGNATSGLGIDKQKINNNIYHALVDNVKPEQVIYQTNIQNLYLIPSNVDLSGLEIELASQLGREFFLKNFLQLIDNHEITLIDCPPSLGLLTVNALCAANSVLIPVQCEFYALEGITQLLKTFELVKKNLNPGLEVEGVLLTMADYRTNLAREVIDEIRSYFKDKVYKSIIPRNVRLTEAPSFGKPIVVYDPNSIGAKKYQELAQEILGEELNSNIKPSQEQIAATEDVTIENKYEDCNR